MFPEQNILAQGTLTARRVLVAEDNLINQRIVKALLRKNGHMPTVVPNGRQVLEALEEEPFDVVILDYQMPEMNGLEALQAIRSHASVGIRSLPVIFFTAEADAQALALVAQYGVAQTLQKPVDPGKLLDAVEALGKPTVPSPANQGPAPAEYLHTITGGDAALMVELIDIFAEEAPAAIRKMQDCYDSGDQGQLLKTIHKIRSNYKYVGFTAAEDLLRELEEDVERGAGKDTYSGRLQRLAKMTGEFIGHLARRKGQLLGN
jgi:CheY-like chemotaxis protein